MKNFTLICCCCMIAAALQAQIIHVPGDYPTIQQGINASNPGDTVLVADGLYYEQINFLGKKPLMVSSEFLMDGDTNHIANTIIDGSFLFDPVSASVVYFISGEDVTSVLCGFTIRYGRGTLTSNGTIQGGGIWISGSGAMIRKNIITSNSCEDLAPSTHLGCIGGGIAVDTIQTGSWVIIQDNRIDLNKVKTDKPDDFCYGGGLACGAKVKILNNRINFNRAERTVASGGVFALGGGICCYGNALFLFGVQSDVIGNSILGNTVSGNYSIGGGMYCSTVQLNCSRNTFKGNNVGSTTPLTNLGGGGLAAGYCLTGSIISNNLFKSNSSESWAGALHVEDFASANHVLSIENNYFLENQATGWGGALGVYNGKVKLVNNVFSHNMAGWAGVGYIDRSSLVPDEHQSWLINNTFAHNKSVYYDGALEFSNSNPLIMNSIFWQNVATYFPDINVASGIAEISYTDINTAGIGGTHYLGPGIITSDPLFADTLNLIPELWSPCRDAGIGSYTCMHNITTVAPAKDILGSWRPKNNLFDMGAYELGHLIHVPVDFPTIQSGINAAIAGDTVLVANGTYYEQVNFQGKKPLMVTSEFLMDGDTSHISQTIIDGSQATDPNNASVVYFVSGEDSTSVLCGFTIQRGKGTYWDVWNSYIGGGIYIDSSSATIRNNIIQNNVLNDTLSGESWGCVGAGIGSAYGYPGWVIIEDNLIANNRAISNHDWTEGAGVYVYVTNTRINSNKIINNLSKNTGYGGGVAGGLICEGDENVLIDAIVSGNEICNNEARGIAASYGGGMGAWNLSGISLVGNNKFTNNSCEGYGGGIDIFSTINTTFNVENNYFIGNEAMLGGAIDVWDSTSRLNCQNNVFSGNKAISQGGAIWLNRDNGSPVEHLAIFTNNSFYNNTSDETAGAIYSYEDNPLIFNSILYQNPDVNGKEMVVESGYTEIAYSDIDTAKITGESLVGPGVIAQNPLFSDLILLTTERSGPCVDAGFASFTCNCGDIHYAPSYDMNGVPRPVGWRHDIGAYETDNPLGIPGIKNSGMPFSASPNPFSTSITFTYTLPESSPVTLCVYDNYGRLVAELVNAFEQKGEQKIEWNAGDLPTGIYYCRFQAGNNYTAIKIIKM